MGKKQRTQFICTQCGYESPKWIGKCPSCDQWNSLREELLETSKKGASTAQVSAKRAPVPIKSVNIADTDRIMTGIHEFDRTLGGGFIPGSVVLLAGEPGIGKSTLILQAAAGFQGKVLYISGEESASQIAQRAARIHAASDSTHLITETSVEQILYHISAEKPDLVIIDSIQTMEVEALDNSPGTVTQVRESASAIIDSAKQNHYPVVLIGHVTKDGSIAGPKTLEHMVDTVLQFEGDTHHSYRIVRALKNRYGSTNEIGIFEMREDGLAEITNPSRLFLNERDREISGTAIVPVLEGTRALLVEVQALVSPTPFGYPQRVATGFDHKRLAMLLAVIEKRAGHRVSTHDVFLNVTGGVRLDEPAVDLAVCSAIVSGLLDKPLKPGLVIAGEVGLGGEIRSVSHIQKRVQEAEKLGFTHIVIPSGNGKQISTMPKIKLITPSTLFDLFSSIF